MSNFVVDASVACSWVLPDETSIIADTAYSRLETAGAVAPDLLWHEIRNVLMMTFRRKRISFAMVAACMGKLRLLPIETSTTTASDQFVLALAERHGLTAYDAAYLALAMELALPLATLDKQLITAASREGVPLLT